MMPPLVRLQTLLVINFTLVLNMLVLFLIFTQYSKATTTHSLGGIRQQFSLAENIQMSQYSFQFLTEIDQHLRIEGCEPPDIQLNRQGYLFLASKEGEEKMKKNHDLQRLVAALTMMKIRKSVVIN